MNDAEDLREAGLVKMLSDAEDGDEYTVYCPVCGGFVVSSGGACPSFEGICHGCGEYIYLTDAVAVEDSYAAWSPPDAPSEQGRERREAVGVDEIRHALRRELELATGHDEQALRIRMEQLGILPGVEDDRR